MNNEEKKLNRSQCFDIMLKTEINQIVFISIINMYNESIYTHTLLAYMTYCFCSKLCTIFFCYRSTSGLVVEQYPATVQTRVRFPAGAFFLTLVIFLFFQSTSFWANGIFELAGGAIIKVLIQLGTHHHGTTHSLNLGRWLRPPNAISWARFFVRFQFGFKNYLHQFRHVRLMFNTNNWAKSY